MHIIPHRKVVEQSVNMGTVLPFSTVNRWLREKEVRYFVVASFVQACVCVQMSYSQKSVPTRLIDTS